MQRRIRAVEIRKFFEGDPHSIQRFDDQILFAPTLWITDQTRAPLLHATRRHPDGLFDGLAEHFEAASTHAGERVYPGWLTADEDDDEADDSAEPDLEEEGVQPFLSARERELLTTTLMRWGLDAPTIADTLTNAAFVPGLTGLQSADPDISQGVAIMVDEDRDRLLTRLFRIRAERNDEAFRADWDIDSIRTRIWTDPDAPEALIAYTIHISKPISLTRTYLLLASKGGGPLS